MSRAGRIAFLRELRARQAFQKVRRRAPKRLPRQQQPDPQRLQYFSILKRGPLAVLRRQLDVQVKPHLFAWAAKGAALQARHDHLSVEQVYWLAQRLDADDPDPNDVIDEMRDTWTRTLTTEKVAELVQPIAYSVSEFQKAQFNRQIKAAVGVDIYRTEPWLQPAIEDFTRRNVALIKSIGEEFYPDLEKRLAQGISDGLRQEELQKLVEERYGVAESRAALIARDQVGKFFGDLNEKRQAGLGIRRYTWRTAGDNRVREEHAEREGEVYSWDDPPEDDAFGPVNPGDAINCRCVAEPILQDVLDEIGAG